MNLLKKKKEACLFMENRMVMKTMHNVRVAGGGPGNAPIEVIDTYGNIRPSSVWGNTYFVDYRNGVDTNNGLTKGNARKTISSVNTNLVTSNNWDLVVVDPDSTVAETAMVTIANNRVNFVGDLSGRVLGAGVKWSVGVTTAATDIGTVKNTGVRNAFTGIKFINNNTVAQGIYSLVEAGEYAVYNHCEIYKSTDLDQTAAAELLHNGDSARFYKCALGSTANAVTSGVRANCLLTATISGKKCRDSVFEDCKFLSKANTGDHNAVYGANATDVERMLTFENCLFFNNPLSTQTPDVAIEFGAAQTEGAVFCDSRCAVVDWDVMANTGDNIFVMSPDSPTYATSGLSVAS
jgi:hypothetical protein